MALHIKASRYISSLSIPALLLLLLFLFNHPTPLHAHSLPTADHHTPTTPPARRGQSTATVTTSNGRLLQHQQQQYKDVEEEEEGVSFEGLREEDTAGEGQWGTVTGEDNNNPLAKYLPLETSFRRHSLRSSDPYYLGENEPFSSPSSSLSSLFFGADWEDPKLGVGLLRYQLCMDVKEQVYHRIVTDKDDGSQRVEDLLLNRTELYTLLGDPFPKNKDALPKEFKHFVKNTLCKGGMFKVVKESAAEIASRSKEGDKVIVLNSLFDPDGTLTQASHEINHEDMYEPTSDSDMYFHDGVTLKYLLDHCNEKMLEEVEQQAMHGASPHSRNHGGWSHVKGSLRKQAAYCMAAQYQLQIYGLLHRVTCGCEVMADVCTGDIMALAVDTLEDVCFPPWIPPRPEPMQRVICPPSVLAPMYQQEVLSQTKDLYKREDGDLPPPSKYPVSKTAQDAIDDLFGASINTLKGTISKAIAEAFKEDHFEKPAPEVTEEDSTTPPVTENANEKVKRAEYAVQKEKQRRGQTATPIVIKEPIVLRKQSSKVNWDKSKQHEAFGVNIVLLDKDSKKAKEMKPQDGKPNREPDTGDNSEENSKPDTNVFVQSSPDEVEHAVRQGGDTLTTNGSNNTEEEEEDEEEEESKNIEEEVTDEFCPDPAENNCNERARCFIKHTDHIWDPNAARRIHYNIHSYVEVDDFPFFPYIANTKTFGSLDPRHTSTQCTEVTDYNPYDRHSWVYGSTIHYSVGPVEKPRRRCFVSRAAPVSPLCVCVVRGIYKPPETLRMLKAANTDISEELIDEELFKEEWRKEPAKWDGVFVFLKQFARSNRDHACCNCKLALDKAEQELLKKEGFHPENDRTADTTKDTNDNNTPQPWKVH
eukprot:Nk52_evm18s348 gene=Nk52_evmTU18s348